MNDPYRLAGEKEMPLPVKKEKIKLIINKDKISDYILYSIISLLMLGFVLLLIFLLYLFACAVIDINDPLSCNVQTGENSFKVYRHSQGDIVDESIAFFPTRAEAEKFMNETEMCQVTKK